MPKERLPHPDFGGRAAKIRGGGGMCGAIWEPRVAASSPAALIALTLGYIV